MRFMVAFCILAFNTSIWALGVAVFLMLWKVSEQLDELKGKVK